MDPSNMSGSWPRPSGRNRASSSTSGRGWTSRSSTGRERSSKRTHIQNLCSHLARAYGMSSRRIELASRIGDVQLDLDLAVPCSLIVNELVSNALKHAFPDGRAGRVCVELQPFGDKQHVLVVGDDGLGLPPALDCHRADSLGLQLVDDLTQQLHGSLVVSRDGGTTFTIAFDTDRGGERER